MSDWTDEDGNYPTDAALARLERWNSNDAAGALDFVKTIWHWSNFASHELRPCEAELVHAEPGDRYLRLATGGWSGNELIVRALNRNTLVHIYTWRLQTFGGLWIYQYPIVDSEPHIIGTEPATVENDPVGRFRLTS